MTAAKPASRIHFLVLVCWIAATVVAATLTGCGSREVLRTVSGRVSFRGQPISKAVVLFSNSEKGIYVTAEVGAEGRYVVQMARGAGLPLGSYQVSVTPPPITAPPMTTGPIPAVPKTPERTDIPREIS